MDFTSGVGSQQLAINSTATSAAKPAGPVRPSDSVAKAGAVSIATAVHADQASLSSVGGLMAQALEGSDTRNAKVAALQATIADGSYSVSSSDVANKIIQSLLD